MPGPSYRHLTLDLEISGNKTVGPDAVAVGNTMDPKEKIKYTVVLFPEDQGGYTVVFPALPGCVTCGDSVEEALSMAQEAIELYLESEIEQNQEIPLESREPLIAAVSVDLPAKKVIG